MKNNEMIIQETIKNLEGIFNRELSSATTTDFKSDFEKTKDNIYNIMIAGSMLAKNLIYSVDSSTLNVSNWYEVLFDSLDCNHNEVYNYVLDKFGLDDNELHDEVFQQGFNTIYDSLRDTYELSEFFDQDLNEVEFLEEFIEIDEDDDSEEHWDNFISYIISKAENMLEGIIECFDDEEYLSQFDDEDDEEDDEEDEDDDEDEE